jgi:hypothetical protein
MNDVFSRPVGAGCTTGRRVTRGMPWRDVTVYAAACMVGGALTGSLVAAVGLAVRDVAGVSNAAFFAAAIGVVVIASVLELSGRVAPLPQRRRQVPRRWLFWRRRSVTAAAFGVMIGSGVLTFLEHATAYALWVLVAGVPDLATGAALGAAYGLGRGLALQVTWLSDTLLGHRLRWEVLHDRHRSTATVLVVASLVAAMTTSMISI